MNNCAEPLGFARTGVRHDVGIHLTRMLFPLLIAFAAIDANAGDAVRDDQVDRKKAIRVTAAEQLDPGQLELQNWMYEYAEFWYNLSYVRNSTPPGKTAETPVLTTSPGFACRETNVSATDNIDDFPLFASVPSNIYLGSIIKGDTLTTATYGVFSGPRNKGKITLSAPFAKDPIATVEMSSISQANYLDALRQLLASGIVVPAATGFVIERIYSQDQLNFAMKANVSGQNFDVATQFSIKSNRETQYALVSVNQLFFRAYLDRPDYAADFWAPNLRPEEIEIIKKEMTVYNPPLYVSAIDYGRKAYILFEASGSSMDIQAALSAGYKSVVDVDGEMSLEVKQALQSMSAKGFVIGGSAKLGNNTIAKLFSGGTPDGLDALKGVGEWLVDGAEPSLTNPPAAIGYEFALLLDGSKVAARSTTNYKEVDCKVGVCPSGFFYGSKNYASWFEINIEQNPRIAPAAGLIGDVIDIQDGAFYTYTWPSCDRITWRNISLKCVPNERADSRTGENPPGIWTWHEESDRPKHEIVNDYHCVDFNSSQRHMSAKRINSDGAPPVILDTAETGPKVQGYAKDPKSYWRWREETAN